MVEGFDCVYCDNDARLDWKVIFVRAQVDGKWGSHPCCTKCWIERNLHREAHTCSTEIFDA